METLERTTHPAKFSNEILHELVQIADKYLPFGARILDPFAGVGKVHFLREYGYQTVGLEIEEEWAMQSMYNIVGDALNPPFRPESFDAIITSPCYGSRMADNYTPKDKSKRFSYRICLGRELSPGSAAGLQWGKRYRDFHMKALLAAREVLKPGCPLIWNVSNHIRDNEEMLVVEWYQSRLDMLGFDILDVIPVKTKRLGFGANREARVPFEQIIIAR